MPRASSIRPALAGWHLISLRPAGGHDALRRAAAKHGAQVFALSPWRLQNRSDAATRDALRDALSAERVVFTSPAAVKAAAALRRLRPGTGRSWFAIGEGTASALKRAGIAPARIRTPERQDSEGLLALPELQRLRGTEVGLITAPGGRDAIAPALRARGARVRRCDVYERVPTAQSAATLARLRGLVPPYAVVASSGEALRRTLASLPADLADKLRAGILVVASERIAALATEAGFRQPRIAAGPRPADLVAAVVRATVDRRFR